MRSHPRRGWRTVGGSLGVGLRIEGGALRWASFPDPWPACRQAQVIRNTAEAVFQEAGASVEFRVGALVEIPRACLIAGQVICLCVPAVCGVDAHVCMGRGGR